RPKCVLCEHRAALAYAWAKAEVEELGPGSRQLLGSHFTFDPAQGDVFGALTLGATLVALPRATVLGALHDALGLDVSHATMTPTQWSLKAPGLLPKLQHLTLCGETMRVETIENWSSALALRNMYGVTEATGLQTSHRTAIGDSPKLVGCALPGYIVALSEEAEILLAGRGLARGYLGRDEETKSCFVDIPAIGDAGTEARAYRTGDLGASSSRGLILKGRKDHQVKISGVRVELSEVELAVLAAGLVSACTVVVAEGVLVAHVALGNCAMDWILRATLEACAAARLPKEVVPHHFQAHEKLPLAPGGKVHRQALEVLGLGACGTPGGPITTPLEDSVAVAWAAALRRPKEQLGRNSNFLWLGGDSLAALRACRALREVDSGVDCGLESGVQSGVESGKWNGKWMASGVQSGEESGTESCRKLKWKIELKVERRDVERDESGEWSGVERGVVFEVVVCWYAEISRCCEAGRPIVQSALRLEEVRLAADSVEAQDLDVQQEHKESKGVKLDYLWRQKRVLDQHGRSALCAECGLGPTLQQYAAFLEEQGVDVSGVFQPLANMASAEDAGTGSSAELALAAAAREGRQDLVKALLQVGTSPNGSASGTPPRGYTPLHAACAAGQAGIAMMLLDGKANVRAMTEARTSPAHLAAAQGDAAILTCLLAADGPEGVATWARDADQQTILHLAARSGEVKAVELVLAKVKGLRAKDGGLEAKDRWSRTALQWAVANNHEEAAVCLIRHGAFSGGIPDALLEGYQVDFSAPSKPGQPKAARKEVQSAAKIASLVAALPCGVESCKEKQLFALTALRDFCCGAKEHREAARQSGAVIRLLGLLPGGQSEVVAAAAQTLRNIAADRAGAMAICQGGGIRLLLDVAKRGPEHPEAWRAASALTNVAEFAELAPAVREAGAASVLQSLSGQLPSSLRV
ncbi:atnA, partial [Symbiodinium pilosum]